MRWLFVFILSIISLLFLGKGIELWIDFVNVDVEGIKISFLGLNINEKVFQESIPGYALGFTVSALIPILVAINIVLKRENKKIVNPEHIG